MSTLSPLAPSLDRVLLVEDDENLRHALADNLGEAGFSVQVADSLANAHAQIERLEFDLVVLDLMLPDGDGYTFCRDLRARGSRIPVLMLTARSLEEDLLQGFDAGADDYLTKPFRLKELLARARALLRRSQQTSIPESMLGCFGFDRVARTVRDPQGNAVDLTRTEFDLLAYLLANRDVVLTRDQILDQVWGKGVLVDYRTVDNFISSLRRKVADHPRSGLQIATVRGVGYRLTVCAP